MAEAGSPMQKNVSYSEEAEFETPVAAAHSTHHSTSEQFPGITLNSMHNGIEDLLLDLEFVEKKASFKKEETAVVDGSTSLKQDR